MELFHHGIKGQKWGVRRYQNKDGTRTALGKKRRQEIPDYKTINQTRYNWDSAYRQKIKKTFEAGLSAPSTTKDEKYYINKTQAASGVKIQNQRWEQKGGTRNVSNIYNKEGLINEDYHSKFKRGSSIIESGREAEIADIAKQSRRIAREKSTEEAAQYIADKLKDYKYEYAISHQKDIEYGLSTVKEFLAIYGDNNSWYTTWYEGGTAVGEYSMVRTRDKQGNVEIRKEVKRNPKRRS